MDSAPDPLLVNSPNINSVLKPPKARVPLKDLMSAAPDEDTTAVRKRRVSFANVNKIKEFSAGAESMVVCQTPAYEEPFSCSSDSSYPSGVDGWTPNKVQLVQPTHHPEKENLSIPTLRMSTGMDLTSIIGNSAYSTRYSVDGMDLTDVANSHKLANIDQQTRFSLGMDLTNAAATRNSSWNTRYSVSGMDLTSTAQSHHDVLLDQENELSVGMDFTGAIGHFTQSTRYSINGMDLTGAANLHHLLPYKRSARVSVGMDMTDVVGNPMNTMRYSCNEMDLTEAVKPFSCSKSYENEIPTNTSINDSDALDLTEAVEGIQFSAVSPKYKINDVGLTENVLYSVNNTRYSVNMDMTSAIGPRLSTTRRKSSRYSLVNMDLTEVLDNSCDDVEFTQTIDPRIKTGSTRNSVCEMDLTESVDESLARISLGCMDQTNTRGKLECSAGPESLVNLTKPTSTNIDPSIPDNENVLTNERVKLISPSSALYTEDPTHVDPKDINISLHSTTAQDSIFTHTTKDLLDNNKQHPRKPNSPLQNYLSVNNVKDQSDISEESPSKSNNAVTSIKKDLSFDVNGSLVTAEEKLTFYNNKTSVIKLPEEILIPRKVEGNVSDTLLLDTENCNSAEQKQVSSLNECKQNKNIMSIDNFNHSSVEEVVASEHKFSSCQTLTRDLIFEKNTKNNKNPSCEESMVNDDAMNISITDTTSSEKLNSTQLEQPVPSEAKNSQGDCCLNETVMNMSLGNISLDQNWCIEDTNVQEENGDTAVETMPSGAVSNTDDQEDNNQINFTTSKDTSFKLKISPNLSLNLSNRSVLGNKNITITRGGSKSLMITPNTSLNISNRDQMIAETAVTPCKQSTFTELQTRTNAEILNSSESNLKHGISSSLSETSSGSRGKRSFEVALEPENDTEESPVKQLCISREEHTADCEIVNNVTVPSFLMDTVSASNETDSCIGPQETPAEGQGMKPKVENITTSNLKNCTLSSSSLCKNNQETCLPIDNSFTCDMSESPICHAVIDLCESSFDATTTEVRDLINNSRYKSTNVADCGEFGSIQNNSLNCAERKCDPSGFFESDGKHIGQTNLSETIKEETDGYNLNMKDALKMIGSKREEENCILEPSHPIIEMRSHTHSRKYEKLWTVGKNTFAAILIPKWIEISFTIDSCENVVNVNYKNIYNGGDPAIGEYLHKQAKNYAIPKKGSDLFLHLQSATKSYLARLARTMNIICKYHNGKIKGDILTLEVVSSRNHFWTFIDVNIKHPQSLNQTDVTISKQKVGDLKLSLVRKVFNSIETNEDQLLNFAKAITKMQRNDFEVYLSK